MMPAERLAAHMHDTYGQALANILASLQVRGCMRFCTFECRFAATSRYLPLVPDSPLCAGVLLCCCYHLRSAPGLDRLFHFNMQTGRFIFCTAQAGFFKRACPKPAHSAVGELE